MNQAAEQDRKIVEARIIPRQSEFIKPMVMVKFEGDEEETFLFNYYEDEISFTADEFIGLTGAEARSLKGKKDLAYLRG
jgi:hypothetical protein